MNGLSNATVAKQIAAALQRHGVEMIFAQSLPSAVVLACEEIGIRQIAYRQENMGGVMADGYARISGRVSVVCAQNGPAATLLVPPLAEAIKASVPIIALVQDVERNQTDRNAFQDFDQMALFASCAKWVRRLNSADRVDDYIDQAFIAAASGRPGPAVLLLPADLLREPAVSSGARKAALGVWPIDRMRPDDATIRLAVEKIAQAKQPVIMAGGGVHAAGAFDALAHLQDLVHIPVCTTNMGKGAVNEYHPLSLGVIGALTGPKSLGRHTRKFLDGADLIILIGTRTNQNGTDSWRLLPRGADIIHIDADPQEIGRNYEAMRLVGDSRSTLEALCAVLAGQDLTQHAKKRAEREQRIAQMWSVFADDQKTLCEAKQHIRPERVMASLQAHLQPDAIMVADASYSSMWVVGQLRAQAAGSRFITPRGLAGLGWGLPLAMGAKLARPGSKVIALVGDGGFAHSWAELETLVRSGIALVLIVLNNGVLGYQKDAEQVKFGSYTSACHFAPVNHADIAKACGCLAKRVEDLDQLDKILAEAMASDRPWLVEVMTDPDAHPAISLYDGTLDHE